MTKMKDFEKGQPKYNDIDLYLGEFDSIND